MAGKDKGGKKEPDPNKKANSTTKKVVRKIEKAFGTGKTDPKKEW